MLCSTSYHLGQVCTGLESIILSDTLIITPRPHTSEFLSCATWPRARIHPSPRTPDGIDPRARARLRALENDRAPSRGPRYATERAGAASAETGAAVVPPTFNTRALQVPSKGDLVYNVALARLLVARLAGTPMAGIRRSGITRELL